MHRVVVGVLCRDGREVLLCHRTPDREWYPNVWDFPGGHIEHGEVPLQALVRELFEEVGVIVNVKHLSEAPDLQVEHEDLELSLWLVRSWTGVAVNRATSEHDEIEWVDIPSAISRPLAHPAFRQWLATLEVGPPNRR